MVLGPYEDESTTPQRRHHSEEIIAKLCLAEVLLGQAGRYLRSQR